MIVSDRVNARSRLWLSLARRRKFSQLRLSRVEGHGLHADGLQQEALGAGLGVPKLCVDSVSYNLRACMMGIETFQTVEVLGRWGRASRV